MNSLNPATLTAKPISQVNITRDWSDLPIIPNDPRFDQTYIARVSQNLAVTTLRKAQVNGLRRVGVVSPKGDARAEPAFSCLAQGFRQVQNALVLCVTFDPPVGRRTGDAQTNGCDDHGTDLTRISQNVAVLNVGDTSTPSLEQLTSDEVFERIEDCDATLRPDLVLFALPALLDHPDTLAIAPMLDAILISVTADQTTKRDLQLCQARLEGVLPLLGTVLTNSRGLR